MKKFICVETVSVGEVQARLYCSAEEVPFVGRPSGIVVGINTSDNTTWVFKPDRDGMPTTICGLGLSKERDRIIVWDEDALMTTYRHTLASKTGDVIESVYQMK